MTAQLVALWLPKVSAPRLWLSLSVSRSVPASFVGRRRWDAAPRPYLEGFVVNIALGLS